MKLNLLLKSVVITAAIAVISSCDKDFNQIGTDVLGDNDHYGLLTDSTSTTIAYNVPSGAVQTNNLPVNTLGFYDNDVFGKTTSNFITQLALAATSPVFINPAGSIVVDSVYLHVPYFYTPVSIDETSGDTTFREDSLIGNSKIKIDVYRSGFFLENLDSSPGSGLTENKKYFSDDDFSTSLASSRLNEGVLSENDNFEFKKTQIKFYKNDAAGAPATTTVRDRLAPGLFMMLDKLYFENNIIKTNPINLSNNTIFRDYFKGLYFKVSPSPSDPSAKGALNRLNFAQGKITIIYQDKTSITDPKIIKKSIVLNLSGNTVNTFTNNLNPNYSNKLSASYNNTTVGAQRLYLKGGNGSAAVISLFGGRANDDATAANEIQKFRDQKCLISDASLTFTIDKTPGAMTTEIEPRRIYLFDLDNKAPLIDYFSDFTSSSNPKFSKFIHGGIIKLNSDKRGTTYKIKLTNHIQNLVRDKTKKNVKLGLIITESISVIANYALKNPFTYLTNPNAVNPTGSTATCVSLPVMTYPNPLGTVLYGTDLPSTDPKKLKLVIRYTKPE
ncbi:MAG: DUF4270 domain-containing protein [Flavobacterium sp.]|nr:DUF4270 domain-containing protein [Flavobacterium sp.]